MMSSNHEQFPFFARLVTLADSLVAGFNVVDLADHLVSSCLEFLPVCSAGIVLDDQQGSLRVLASSSEETRLLELFEVQNNEGPCLDAFNSGTMVAAADLGTARRRWPSFASAAGSQGILAVYALPMQLRERTIGALNLFCSSREGLTEEHIQIARVMAAMASLGIVNHWSVRRQEVLAEQLQTALDSRVVIEQAKGVLAERSGIDMATAFNLLRSTARESRRPLSELAADVAHGRVCPIVPATDRATPGSQDGDAG